MRLNDVKKEEQEVLETQSIPLRNYLMKHVMPTLSQGLVECTKIRPDDPVDFLVRFASFHLPCPYGVWYDKMWCGVMFKFASLYLLYEILCRSILLLFYLF